MKKTLLAIALAVAAMPLAFAAQGAKTAVPAGTASVGAKPATRSVRKNHVRKHGKKSHKSITASSARVKK
jgi:opacity protein-like surface antigen